MGAVESSTNILAVEVSKNYSTPMDLCDAIHANETSVAHVDASAPYRCIDIDCDTAKKSTRSTALERVDRAFCFHLKKHPTSSGRAEVEVVATHSDSRHPPTCSVNVTS